MRALLPCFDRLVVRMVVCSRAIHGRCGGEARLRSGRELSIRRSRLMERMEEGDGPSNTFGVEKKSGRDKLFLGGCCYTTKYNSCEFDGHAHVAPKYCTTLLKRSSQIILLKTIASSASTSSTSSFAAAVFDRYERSRTARWRSNRLYSWTARFATGS